MVEQERISLGGRITDSTRMTHSMYSADRSTHLRVLIIALISSIVVAGLAIAVHFSHEATTTAVHEVQFDKLDDFTSLSLFLSDNCTL